MVVAPGGVRADNADRYGPTAPAAIMPPIAARP